MVNIVCLKDGPNRTGLPEAGWAFLFFKDDFTMKKSILIFLMMQLPALAVLSQDTEQWWKETVFYQIYMPSFQDSNGDGISDFAGMTSRLGYIQDLGIKGIWLTPFLESPKVDNGYDVADYYRTDPSYGDLNDFKTFLDEAHRRGIRVIMDMVVNHTSTDCRWFQESRKSRDNPYRDYYIWRDEPNNWESFFGGKAWEYDSVTLQYYYHKFDVRMADLNWGNPAVAEEISRVLRFWLDLGVDGFRMDVINFLTTDGILSDNPMKDGSQQHIYDIDQPGIKVAMARIRSVVDEYPGRFLVGEVGSDKLEILKEYQSPETMDVVFNFNFGSIPGFSPGRLYRELRSMNRQMPGYPTLFFGSHDNPRPMSRLAGGSIHRAKALAALILSAKGVPFVYFGDELGMENIIAKSPEEIVDVQGRTHYRLALEAGKSAEEALEEGNRHNRDKSRSPMQWDNSLNAGFTTGKPWIGVHENHREVNVEALKKDGNSILNAHKGLIHLRNREKTLQYGSMERLKLKKNLLTFTRRLGNDRIGVVIALDLDAAVKLPRGAEILAGTPDLRTSGFVIYRY